MGSTISVFTADSGTFHLSAPGPASLLLQIRRPGYRSELLAVERDWSGTIVLRQGVYELAEVQVTARWAKPVAYAATHKYDDYFKRRRVGLGQFVSREELDRRFAQHTAQLLEGRPGIRVDYRQATEIAGGSSSTIIAFARCNEYPPKINVYVDGHKLQPRALVANAASGDLAMQMMGGGISADDPQRRREVRGMVGEMLERINPSDIEFMEIYRGPADLPAEFNDGNCGAIVIWTREGGR